MCDTFVKPQKMSDAKPGICADALPALSSLYSKLGVLTYDDSLPFHETISQTLNGGIASSIHLISHLNEVNR